MPEKQNLLPNERHFRFKLLLRRDRALLSAKVKPRLALTSIKPGDAPVGIQNYLMRAQTQQRSDMIYAIHDPTV